MAKAPPLISSVMRKNGTNETLTAMPTEKVIIKTSVFGLVSIMVLVLPFFAVFLLTALHLTGDWPLIFAILIGPLALLAGFSLALAGFFERKKNKISVYVALSLCAIYTLAGIWLWNILRSLNAM